MRVFMVSNTMFWYTYALWNDYIELFNTDIISQTFLWWKHLQSTLLEIFGYIFINSLRWHTTDLLNLCLLSNLVFLDQHLPNTPPAPASGNHHFTFCSYEFDYFLLHIYVRLCSICLFIPAFSWCNVIHIHSCCSKW